MIKKVNIKKHKQAQDKTFGDIVVCNIMARKNIEIYKQVAIYLAEIFEEYGEKLQEDENAEIDGYQVIRNLLPIMTNIDFEDVSEEEIEDTLVNPSEDLSKTIAEITHVIQDVVIPQLEEMITAISKMNEVSEEGNHGTTISKIDNRDEEKERLRAEFRALSKRNEEN